jgi:DNA-binding transcriptional LysR family regulator
VGDLAKALATGEGSTLRIAASPSLGSVVLARALALFVRRHPGVDVDIVTLAHPAVVDRIVLRQAELGLSQFAADHPGIVQERLIETPLLLALPDGSPLARHAVVPLAALEGLPLISYPAASPVGALVRTHFSRHGMVLRAAVTVRYPMIACFFVEAGIGAAIVDAFVVLDRAAWRFAVRRFEPAPSSEIWALHGSARPLSHNARDFLRAVRQVLRDAN